MAYSVFIDTIGKIHDGNYETSVENYERYKEFSQRGIGRFSEKNVYLLGDGGSIIKSFGSTKFESGGTVSTGKDFIKDFILGKKINRKDLTDDFSVLESTALIYKSQDGQYPLITKKVKDSAIFHKSNFSSSDYINSLIAKFKEVCIKNAIQFQII